MGNGLSRAAGEGSGSKGRHDAPAYQVDDLYAHPLVRSPLASRIGWGVSEVWKLRKDEILADADLVADRTNDPTGHGAAAIILASLYVGPEVVPVAAALSFDMSFVAECAGRLREAQVWLHDGAMFYPWLDKDDEHQHIGWILDSLVATGGVVKLGPESYRSAGAA